jgi:NitT/TauT family transport system ATP-binding protein
MAAGLEFPTSGSVRVGGKPVTGPGPDRSVVFQQFALFPWKTVHENIDFGLRAKALPEAARRERIGRQVELMGLQGYESAYPHQLSGGMQQRVAIARTLILKPSIILMDEPFSALDEPTRIGMQRLIIDLWHDIHATVFIVTHSITEAVYLGDRVWIFTKGPGTIAVEIKDLIPPSAGVDPLEMQEKPEFKIALEAVAREFKKVTG